jgi:predicted permease
MRSLRQAFRTLFRTPLVTIVAVVSLGLGIGANAAIFSMFNEILLRPLPVHEPDRLVNFSSPGPRSGMTSCGQAGSCLSVFSLPMIRDLQKQQTAFTGIAGHRSFGANVSFNGQSQGGQGLQVTGTYFDVLGLRPAAGRLLGTADDRVNGESAVVVLSHRFWMRRFNGDAGVLNQTLIVNGQPFTIVGVAPEGFDGTTIGSRPQFFVPITMAERLESNRRLLENRRAYWIYVFGRLKPGVDITAAAAAINPAYHAVLNEIEAPLQSGMSAPTLERFRNRPLELADGSRGQSSAPDEARQPLIILLGVTFVVLLSACANIANLLLTKAVGRAGEMAVRLSIGASRRQLIQQLLGESVLLAIMGGAFGVLVAKWTMAAVLQMLPADAAEGMAFAIDSRVLIFMTVVTVGTGLLFGLFPALHGTKPNLAATLKGQSGQPGGSRAAKWFRTSLATTQIVLSMALLGMAGLFLKSLLNVNRVDLGLETQGVVMFGVNPRLNGYTQERSNQIYAQIEDELARLPGVTSVSAGMVPLVGGSNWGTNVSVEGFSAAPDADMHSSFNIVAPDFFKTVGMTLRMGREFTRSDTAGAPKVAVVSEAFTKKFNLGANPIGRRMEQGNSGKLDLEIVGLVKDAAYSEVKEPAPPVFYTPYRQAERVDGMSFYVRAGSIESVMATIPAILARIDATLPVANLRTLTDQVNENVFLDRMVSTMAAVFAALATLLAAIGLYGVLAYAVAQRTREFGLRMALGADGHNIRSLVLKQVAWMTIVGAAAGITLAATGGYFAQALLYQMTGVDAGVLGASAALLALVALIAGLLPAIRASRVDPMKALRYE